MHIVLVSQTKPLQSVELEKGDLKKEKKKSKQILTLPWFIWKVLHRRLECLIFN